MSLLHRFCIQSLDTNNNRNHNQYEISLARVRNPKNQLLQIDPPTIVGCSLQYPIARSTMKPETRLLSSQKYRL